MVEEVEVDESNELQAIMALDDVGIEASINKKDQVVVKKKYLKKAEDALKKSFRKGGAPELHGEEVEINEALKPKDKKVVDDFYDEKEDDQPKSTLSTDGKSLWIAGSKAAEWKNGKIEILHAPTGRFDQSVFKYMRKSIPSLNFAKEEVELTEEFKEKDFDALKKGDTITIEFKSSMSIGKSTFRVTAKNIVGKAKVHKATLQNVKKPNSVKFFLYKRGNKVSLAQGDMAASVVKYTVEEVEMDEAKGTAYPATIDTLRKIVKDKQHQTVMFKSGKAIVDLFTASAMVQVYDALKKPEMKKTFEKMIGDKAGFLKTQEFAMKMISGGK
ncbi:hypothetical protein HOB76_07915, partial [Candidatus Woesearchaeota archaeon]|nr:hypothetical protein [Candidatus Woesearchaeota archaeon]